MAKDRFLVDVRPAPQRQPSSGDDDGEVAAYIILVLIVVFIIGTCL